MLAVLTAGCFAGCANGKPKDDGRLRIVTTIFPEYDWVMNVLGDKKENAEVTMLLDRGVDLHSYQPSAEDILKISVCDLFIYVGGESDGWVDDALKEATNKDMVVINLLEVLGDAVKEEEAVEGMQAGEHEHEHAHEDDHDHDEHEHEHGEEEKEYDEHVWLSLGNAAALTKKISEALSRIDSANAEVYKKNALAYVAKLEELDGKYAEVVSRSALKTVLFADRFPFRYLTDDYGLSYYAAFLGCSAETEASFETVAFLAGKADELSLRVVLTIEGKDHRIAETVVKNTKNKDQQILVMDSLQSVTAEDIKNGTTYLAVMEKNLGVLEKALTK